MKRFLVGLLLSLIATAAIAQSTIPQHSVPISRGPGVSGWNHAAPGSIGRVLMDLGASTPPAFQFPNPGIVDVSVAPYNAKADAQYVFDGAMDNNVTATLTSTSGRFLSTDCQTGPGCTGTANKAIVVANGGTDDPAGTLIGTIVGYISPTQVTLSKKNTSGGAISGKTVRWCTDSTAAINAAIQQNAGLRIRFSGGAYCAGSINATRIQSTTITGAATNNNNFTAFTGSLVAGPGIGTVILPLEVNFPMFDLTGSGGVQIAELGLGQSIDPVVVKCGFWMGQVQNQTSGAFYFNLAGASGSFTVAPICAYATPGIIIQNSGYQNFYGSALAGFFGATNPYNIQSDYATVQNSNSGTVTFTGGNANINWTANGAAVGDFVVLYTGGTLPPEFAINTRYYVVARTTNTLQLSATAGGAAITPSTAGTGTHGAVLNEQAPQVTAYNSYFNTASASPSGPGIRFTGTALISMFYTAVSTSNATGAIILDKTHSLGSFAAGTMTWVASDIYSELGGSPGVCFAVDGTSTTNQFINTGRHCTTFATGTLTLANTCSAPNEWLRQVDYHVCARPAVPNLTAATNNAVVVTTGGEAALTAALTDGQLVFGQTGAVPTPRTVSGDLTFNSTGVGTLSSVITAGGPIGSATVVPIITWDAKGRLTAVSSTTISPSLVVGTTAITSGTDTRVLYNNAGTLGEYAISGTGSVCMTTSCSMTTPALGTPSAAVLTNATGLPIGTGVSGLGTGVATALGVNVGSAGAFVTFNGALGTPSSGTLTNATGLPYAGISSAAWSTYTPTLNCSSGSFTDATATGRYAILGRIAIVSIHVAITTNGTCAGNFTATLPASPTALTGRVFATSGMNYTTGTMIGGQVNQSNNNSALVLKYDGTYSGGDGQNLSFTVVYETN